MALSTGRERSPRPGNRRASAWPVMSIGSRVCATRPAMPARRLTRASRAASLPCVATTRSVSRLSRSMTEPVPPPSSSMALRRMMSRTCRSPSSELMALPTSSSVVSSRTRFVSAAVSTRSSTRSEVSLRRCSSFSIA